MSKSTPRKRTTRATDTTSRTGTRKRTAARSPAAKTAARKEAATRKSMAAAGESKAGRLSQEPNEEALTLADYAEQVQTAVRAASAKKAEKIMILDLRHTSAFTDVFVLCTGQNARQVKAIVDSVEEALKALGQRPVAVEGYRGSEWVLVDYFDFVVHVFTPESREFYALERLWGSAIRVEVADEPVAAIGGRRPA
ncbi:MAG TPA: ribosome silencing factor [Vicinamibacterales bacterium]|nr:ribosome silencing factor [Vicinamibacterales bacterium]